MSRIFATANTRFLATSVPITLSSLRNFPAPLPRSVYRGHYRPPERARLEGGDSRHGRPPGRGHHVLELPGVPSRLAHHPPGPLDRGRGEAKSLLPAHPGADRAVRQRLDEEESEGGARPGQRGDHIQEFLAGELGDGPE